MWYYKNPANPPEEKAFAEAYLKKHGKPAADKAWMGWITAKSVFEAIELAKSTATMPIIEGLEAWKFQAGSASYAYRRFDHQMLVRNLAVSVKDRITDQWDYFDVKATLPENPADLDKVFGTPEEIGCKMA
jgi:branched-chain amino acid transport system substrate-binding protein